MNKTSWPIPLGLILVAALSAGLYVSRDAPVLAVGLTWEAPVADGCNVAPDGYFVQLEVDGALFATDTVFTNSHETFLPVGHTRFRVVGWVYDDLGGMDPGRVTIMPGCVVTDSLSWSVWSQPIYQRQTVGRVFGPPTVEVLVR